MHSVDLTTWQGLLSTVIGLALFALIGIGIRVLMMHTIQQRRERMNRQINERLRTLIAAYKTLGGSFTGTLTVDPTHLADLRRRGGMAGADEGAPGMGPPETQALARSERSRRIRDAVEAALSDIILLGTEEHVRLAERMARDLVAGRTVETHELVVSLRDFIREALDLEPIPEDLAVPMQGPARPSSASGRGRAEGRDQGRQGGGRGAGGGGQGGGGGGQGSGGMGLGMGVGVGAGLGAAGDDLAEPDASGLSAPENK